MEALPQPLPDRPTPPHPGPEARASRAKAKLIWKLGGISIAFCLLFLGVTTRTGHGRHPHDRTEAINNIKQVGMALFEFDNEYGQFPNASTIAMVKAETKTPLTLGTTSSNQLFRQLLVGGGGRSEKPFWARTAISPKKPDGRFDTDATALAPGECGFAYIAGLSSSAEPETPVVMTSLLPGKLSFDPKAFQGKAIILRLDNSATVHPIDKHGHVILNGMDLFDPRQHFWKGKAPDVKWPE